LTKSRLHLSSSCCWFGFGHMVWVGLGLGAWCVSSPVMCKRYRSGRQKRRSKSFQTSSKPISQTSTCVTRRTEPHPQNFCHFFINNKQRKNNHGPSPPHPLPLCYPRLHRRLLQTGRASSREQASSHLPRCCWQWTIR
jgi:hypothetical protein